MHRIVIGRVVRGAVDRPGLAVALRVRIHGARIRASIHGRVVPVVFASVGGRASVVVCGVLGVVRQVTPVDEGRGRGKVVGAETRGEESRGEQTQQEPRKDARAHAER